MRKRILILADSPIHRDPRVLVQIEALKELYDILCVGRTSPNIDGINYIYMGKKKVWYRFIFKLIKPIARLFKCHRLSYFMNRGRYQVLKKIKRENFDIILVNDLMPMYFVDELKRKGCDFKVYLDLHEWFDGTSNKKFEIEYLFNLCRKHCDYITTVNDSLRDLYQDVHDVKINAVVMNLPASQNIEPGIVDNSSIKIVHHGVAARKRSLENIIDVMDLLDDRFKLDFYLVNNNSHYFYELKKYASKNPNITFCEPVPTHEIPYVLSKYDIGIYPLMNNLPNHRYALPNKLFEYIQARLCIAIWPSVEMKKIVLNHQLGVVSNEFNVNELASLINKLDAESITDFKINNHTAANKLNSTDSKIKINQGVTVCIGG